MRERSERAQATERSEGAQVAVTGGDAGTTPEERRALFRVVRGDPTDVEIAALAAVLAVAASAPTDTAAAPDRPAWNDPADRLRRPLPVGPHAWRTSMWRR